MFGSLMVGWAAFSLRSEDIDVRIVGMVLTILATAAVLINIALAVRLAVNP